MAELSFNDDEVKKYQYFYENITGIRLCDPINLQCNVAVPFYDRKFLEKFIELGWEINSPNEGGLTLLSKAAERDDLHRLELLIDLGMELLIENKWGEAAIKTATANNSYIVLDRLNKYKAEVINTSLHAVCANDNFKRVKQLVEEEGADVNARDSLGNRPLHYACARGSLKVVNYLLEKGTVVDCVNLNGNSPLYEACTSIFNRIEIVKRLLQLNPDMKYVDQENNTLLHISIIMGRYEIAELLLDHFETVGQLNHFKESALHLAACYAPTSLIGKLIEKGADVNGKDSEGRTPLHRAVKTNTSQSVELLLCKGADANALDKNMETPIFIAIKRTPGLPFIKALVHHGADLNVKDSNGKTSLEIAFETSELEKAK